MNHYELLPQPWSQHPAAPPCHLSAPLPGCHCSAHHLLSPLPACLHLSPFPQVWCILLIIWFVSVHGPAECEGAWRYDVGVGGLLAAFVLSLGLEIGLVRERRAAPVAANGLRVLQRAGLHVHIACKEPAVLRSHQSLASSWPNRSWCADLPLAHV